jgi:LuxR family quorum sensing-dependent transcriptional regulator
MDYARDVTWRFISTAPVAASQSELDDVFARALEPFGVDRFDCSRVPASTETVGLSMEATLPYFMADRGLSGWKQYYFDQKYYAVDPCVEACAQFNGAYTWTAVKAITSNHLGRMWSDAYSGGMREGLIVPIAPRRMTEAVVRMTTPEDHLDSEAIALIQSIAVVYASTTMSLAAGMGESAAPASESEAETFLTDREIECLHWAARGKTNAEIGAIIRISRHTVNSHVESAKRKLGVATRVQAVAIAHRLGLLSIA